MRLPLVFITMPGLLLLAGCQTSGMQGKLVHPPPPKPQVRASFRSVQPAAALEESGPVYGPPLFLSRVALLELPAPPAVTPIPALKPQHETVALPANGRAVSALAPGEVHANLLGAFRQLDRYPLLATEAGPLQPWANRNGHCAIAYTHKAQIALETTEFGGRRFPVAEAVPVRCAHIDAAYEAATGPGGFSNVEKLDGGRIAAMRHVSGKRDALKRDVTMLVLENQNKTVRVESRGMEEASL